MNVCVVALGKIGLPLAVQFASKGHRVLGADIDGAAVASINAGVPPFPGEAHLDDRLRAALDAGLLQAVTDTTAAVRQSEVVVVVVPLIVDDEKRPDFRALDAATRAIGAGLRPGTLVVYETTLPIHSTRRRFAPMLAELSGLTLGDDLLVAFSPERVYSGRIFADLRRYPKLVGGLDAASTARAISFYEAALDFDVRDDLSRANGVWDLGSAEAAEMAKLAETTYRDVNIGLANEFARFADDAGIDVHAVIEASNSQPFSHIHQPGIAVGGHCIPVYPRFFLSNAPEATLPLAARAANEAMPAYAVDRLEERSGSLAGSTVAVLGICYRGGVKETAFSGAFPLIAELIRRGADVVVNDPLFGDDELRSLGFAPHHLSERCDAAIIQSDHREYATMSPTDLPGCRWLLDGRRCTDRARWVDANVGHIVLGGGAA